MKHKGYGILAILLISALAAIVLYDIKENNAISNVYNIDNIVDNKTKNLYNNTKNIDDIGGNSTNINIPKYDENISLIPKVVCESCHLSGKSNVPQAMKVSPHINGGNYCLDCHKNIHDKHPLNKDVRCESCHGYKNESIPVSGPNIVCINCHDYPNPLNKSYGNLITIHRQRDVSCINCHAKTCTTCHKEMGSNERWEKRLIHFKTIIGAIPYENHSFGDENIKTENNSIKIN